MESILDDKYFEWKISLEFISIFDTKEEVVFNDYTDFVGFVLAEAEIDKVYVVGVGGRVYVTDNIGDVIYFIEMIFNKVLPNPQKSTLEEMESFSLDAFNFHINCSIEEFYTFEEAYMFALRMQS
jgi:hypothetical protein